MKSYNTYSKSPFLSAQEVPVESEESDDQAPAPRKDKGKKKAARKEEDDDDDEAAGAGAAGAPVGVDDEGGDDEGGLPTGSDDEETGVFDDDSQLTPSKLKKAFNDVTAGSMFVNHVSPRVEHIFGTITVLTKFLLASGPSSLSRVFPSSANCSLLRLAGSTAKLGSKAREVRHIY
jgi:hypothetical protein